MRSAAASPVVTLALLLVGCAEPPADIYRHEWTWGHESTRVDDQGDPLFIGGFQSDEEGTWVMNVTSEVVAGTYQIQMRAPDGRVRLVVTEPGNHDLEGMEGRWTVEILTDPDERGDPEGGLLLVVSNA